METQSMCNSGVPIKLWTSTKTRLTRLGYNLPTEPIHVNPNLSWKEELFSVFSIEFDESIYNVKFYKQKSRKMHKLSDKIGALIREYQSTPRNKSHYTVRFYIKYRRQGGRRGKKKTSKWSVCTFGDLSSSSSSSTFTSSVTDSEEEESVLPSLTPHYPTRRGSGSDEELGENDEEMSNDLGDAIQELREQGSKIDSFGSGNAEDYFAQFTTLPGMADYANVATDDADEGDEFIRQIRGLQNTQQQTSEQLIQLFRDNHKKSIDYERSMQNMRDKLVSAEAKILKFQKAKERKNQGLKKARQEMIQCQSELDKERNIVSQWMTKAASLEAEIVSPEGLIEFFQKKQTEIEELRDKNVRLSGMMNSLEVKVNGLILELHVTRRNETGLKSQVGELYQKLESLTKERDDINAKMEFNEGVLQNAISALSAKLPQ